MNNNKYYYIISKNCFSFCGLYSKEPKSVPSFNSFTFFHADINQSEVEDSFQLASDWIINLHERINANKSKAVTLLGFLL